MAELILTAFDWVPEMPRGFVRDLRVAMEWLFAALNSVEMASLPWSILAFSGDTGDTPGWKRSDAFLKARLQHLEPVLAGREWLAGTFSVAFGCGRLSNTAERAHSRSPGNWLACFTQSAN